MGGTRTGSNAAGEDLYDVDPRVIKLKTLEGLLIGADYHSGDAKYADLTPIEAPDIAEIIWFKKIGDWSQVRCCLRGKDNREFLVDGTYKKGRYHVEVRVSEHKWVPPDERRDIFDILEKDWGLTATNRLIP